MQHTAGTWPQSPPRIFSRYRRQGWRIQYTIKPSLTNFRNEQHRSAFRRQPMWLQHITHSIDRGVECVTGLGHDGLSRLGVRPFGRDRRHEVLVLRPFYPSGSRLSNAARLGARSTFEIIQASWGCNLMTPHHFLGGRFRQMLANQHTARTPSAG